ncbi:MAG: DEAD/DEAH box helicase [Firmicutes bacterium]|nr:DEAD/DEAH box helicase [Bacillota bacterium]
MSASIGSNGSKAVGTFENLSLDPSLLRAVWDSGYQTPTPIQARAIPLALEGRDVLGCAQTGTGKTAAFALPILNRLRTSPRGGPRALILTPTRELAAQVAESFHVYGRHLPLRSSVVYGGVGMEPQIRQLQRGVEILVATPGRLLDLMGRGHVKLSGVEVLVLDEADRMLDMGFIPDVRRILRSVPARRQTLFFSATMPPSIRTLAAEVLNDPVLVEAGPRAKPAEGIRQVIHCVERSQKRVLLTHLLREHRIERALVFTRTKHAADRLAQHLLREGWRVGALHSNKSQSARTRALDAFSQGSIQILVATDIASRGLDVAGISHVINYDLPGTAEDYIHRIGRTARASATGDAISFFEPGDREILREIENLIEMRLPLEPELDFSAKGTDVRHGTRATITDAPDRNRRRRRRPQHRHLTSAREVPA